jgi:hypothetical protein
MKIDRKEKRKLPNPKKIWEKSPKRKGKIKIKEKINKNKGLLANMPKCEFMGGNH